MTVYRGTTPAIWRRMSWTTDLERAKWFADRLGLFGFPDTIIATATIPPRHVLALFNDRQESEVVVNPYGLPRILSIC